MNAWRCRLSEIPQGTYVFSDVMDDDGLGNSNIAIRAKLDVGEQEISVDFAGTDFQVSGNINCPLPVVAAAVYYAFRCLMPDYAPACAGLFRPIHQCTRGTLVNAKPAGPLWRQATWKPPRASSMLSWEHWNRHYPIASPRRARAA